MPTRGMEEESQHGSLGKTWPCHPEHCRSSSIQRNSIWFYPYSEGKCTLPSRRSLKSSNLLCKLWIQVHETTSDSNSSHKDWATRICADQESPESIQTIWKLYFLIIKLTYQYNDFCIFDRNRLVNLIHYSNPTTSRYGNNWMSKLLKQRIRWELELDSDSIRQSLQDLCSWTSDPLLRKLLLEWASFHIYW